jgi:ribonuclease P protein component
VRTLSGTPRKEDAPGIYIGLVASTKLHKSAVKRNRMRRRCREAFRITLRDTEAGRSVPRSAQLLLFPKSSSLSADFRELLADATRFLASLTHAR